MYEKLHDIDVIDIERISAYIPENMNKCIEVLKIKSFIKAKELGTVKKGTVLPDICAIDRYDSERSLRPSGKPVILAVLSSGCPYSIISIEELYALNCRYNDIMDMVSVWTDDSRNIWLEKHKEEKT